MIVKVDVVVDLILAQQTFVVPLSGRCKSYRGAPSVGTAVTRGAIGGGVASPGLLDIPNLFCNINGADTIDKSTRTELFAAIL